MIPDKIPLQRKEMSENGWVHNVISDEAVKEFRDKYPTESKNMKD